MKPATDLLRVSGLRGSTVRGVDFELRAGEILGVTGILGSGREHLSRILFGALPRTGGEVLLEGRPCRRESVARRSPGTSASSPLIATRTAQSCR